MSRQSNARKAMRKRAQFTFTRTHWIGMGTAVVALALAMYLNMESRAPAGPLAGGAGDGPVERAPAELKLESAMATVRTQMELLQNGNDRDFRMTFLPYIREAMTPATIAACRDRINNAPVKPAWEAAKEGKDNDGRAATRVTIYAAEVGFHNIEGQWLADYVWCRPGT